MQLSLLRHCGRKIHQLQTHSLLLHHRQEETGIIITNRATRIDPKSEVKNSERVYLTSDSLARIS